MTQKHDSQFPEQEDLGKKGVETESKRKDAHWGESTPRRTLAASLIFATAVIATLCLATLNISTGSQPWMLQALWIALVGIISFLIIHTGRISKWRAVLFGVMAWGFVLYFKGTLVGLRGTAFTTPDIQEVPYCHIAMASSCLNYLYFQYLAFKSGHWLQWGPLSLGVLWLGITLVLGQAWCSWGCFYGGLDDTLSRVLKKPVLRWSRLPARLRELPAAILLVSALLSLTTLLPQFCLWACPLKITTAFLDPYDAVRKIQLVLLVAVGTFALIVLPILTKKRIFCGLICPFGAWQAFWGRLHPFRVTMNEARCTHCELCVKACPTFAIEAIGADSHRIGPYCNRCGECIDVCSAHAIEYTILGRSIKPNAPTRHQPLLELWDARVLFLFSALVVSGAVGGLFIPELLSRCLLATKGIIP